MIYQILMPNIVIYLFKKKSVEPEKETSSYHDGSLYDKGDVNVGNCARLIIHTSNQGLRAQFDMFHFFKPTSESWMFVEGEITYET